VRQIGFIIRKFITMHGHMNVKFARLLVFYVMTVILIKERTALIQGTYFIRKLAPTLQMWAVG
jgi:hypothetical protein